MDYDKIFVITKVNKVIIDGTSFDNAYGYELEKKNDKILLRIANEAMNKEQYNKLIGLLKDALVKENYYTVSIEEELINSDGETFIQNNVYECKIPDEILLKVEYGEVTNLMTPFQVIAINSEVDYI